MTNLKGWVWYDSRCNPVKLEAKNPKKSKWHNVEDTLPHDDRWVLVCAEGGWIDIAYYDKSKPRKWYCRRDLAPTGYVTHWRELPKSPTRKESE